LDELRGIILNNESLKNATDKEIERMLIESIRCHISIDDIINALKFYQNNKKNVK